MRFHGELLRDRLKAWWLGFKEGLGSTGITWSGEACDWRLNEAYDSGRNLRQRIGR